MVAKAQRGACARWSRDDYLDDTRWIERHFEHEVDTDEWQQQEATTPVVLSRPNLMSPGYKRTRFKGTKLDI